LAEVATTGRRTSPSQFEHNAVLAEFDYGKAKMAQYRRSGNRVSEGAAI
jgi:hypothetical protein